MTSTGVDISAHLWHPCAVRPLPEPSPAAFSLPATSPVGACLLIHGYTGTPYEVRVPAEAIHDAFGFRCEAPLLPGHGDDPATLNHLDADDWLHASIDAYDAVMHNVSGPRVVVGSSMGALLSLHLSLVRRVDALVLLAPALRLTESALVGVFAMSLGLWRLMPFIIKEGPGGDVGAEDALRINPTYKLMPSRGLTKLLSLQWRTERILKRVTTPLCLIHGDLDGTIVPSSSAQIAKRVSSTIVEHHRLPNTRHLVGLDVERDEAAAIAVSFLRRVLA